MGKTFSTGLLTNGLWQDSSNNIGIGAAANASFKLQVTGATNLTGALTASTATFESSGSGNTFLINHTSGSGIALTITKGGNGEGLIINKTSGTGNALSVTGTTSLGGALSGTSATFSGILSATSGDIRSLGTATDAVTAGPFISVRDASNAYQMLMQLNASYGLDIWSFTGSWNKVYNLASTGAATFTGNNASNTTENASVSWNDSNGNLMGRIVGYRGANGNDGNLRFYTSNTPTLSMTITSGGNVGIGKISPIGKLDVLGTSFVGNNTSGPNYGVTSTTKSIANGATADCFEIEVSDNYGGCMYSIDLAGGDINGQVRYFTGKRMVEVNGGTSITVYTIGTDVSNGGISMTSTHISGQRFKVTVTNTTGQTLYCGVSIQATAGGTDGEVASWFVKLINL
jgi:hypothetical protein